MKDQSAKNWMKAVPGFAVSAFFIWWTYIRRNKQGERGFDTHAFGAIHLAAPAWIAGLLIFAFVGYGLRCFRWWWMLRKQGAKLSQCARVLMTSLAANNILPLRIGDVMRIFTYAEDLGSTPSTVLSTVILEKLLDVFTLAVFFVVTMHFDSAVPGKIKQLAEVGVAVSTVALLVLVFGARQLHRPLQRLSETTQHKVIGKVEHYLGMAVESIESIGVAGTLMLIVFSFAAWGCEGFMYTSLAKLIGFPTDRVGPWQGMTEANLSFILPSSPGGIGLFEAACKDAFSRHSFPAQGLNAAQMGVVFGTIMHLWLLLGITGVGGIWFLVHRAHLAMRKPLLEEVEALPSPVDL